MSYPSDDLTLRRLQREQREWSDRNFPNVKPYQPLLGALEELGELAHAHLKAEEGIRGTPAEHQAKKIDAVADVVIFLANYCSQNGIDFQDAVETTWNVVRRRDYVANPHNPTEVTV